MKLKLRIVVVFAFRLLALTLVHLLGFVIAAQVTGVGNHSESNGKGVSVSPRQQTKSSNDNASTEPINSTENYRESNGAISPDRQSVFFILMLVCLLNSAALMMWILLSTIHGIRMVAAVFVVFLMCMTVMPQIETFFFLSEKMDLIRMAMVMGLVVCGVFSIAAVPILGRWKAIESQDDSPQNAGTRSIGNIAWRLAVCALVYALLYVLFGFFVAWQNPELRLLYGGGQLSSFFDHMGSRFVITQVIPLQLARGIAWTLLCLFMMQFMHRSRFTQALVIGFVLAIVMNSQLLIPNALMPQSVRISHIIETAPSNFLFGVFCVVLWSKRNNNSDRAKQDVFSNRDMINRHDEAASA